MRKEPYSGAEFYRYIKGYVSVAVYIPRGIRAAYHRAAKKLKKLGDKTASAQKLMAKALVRGAKRSKRR